MLLDSEKFRSLEELVEIQKQLATTRAEFDDLRSSLEEFKQLREKEGFEKVAEAIVASQEALSEADKNRDILASYLASIKDLSKEVVLMKENLVEEMRTFNSFSELLKRNLSEAIEQVKTDTQELKRRRMVVESEKNHLTTEKKKLEQEWMLVKDRSAMIEREITRLKSLK